MRELDTYISEGLVGAGGSQSDRMAEATKGLLADTVIGWVNRNLTSNSHRWEAAGVEVSGKEVTIKVDMGVGKGDNHFFKITDTEGLMEAVRTGYTVRLIPDSPMRNLPFMGIIIDTSLSRDESKALSDALGSFPFTSIVLADGAKADGLDLTVSCGSANDCDEAIGIWINNPKNAWKNINFHMDRSSSDPNSFSIMFNRHANTILDASEISFDGWDWLESHRIQTEVYAANRDIAGVVRDMIENSRDRFYLGDYFKTDVDKIRKWLDEAVLPGGISLKDTMNYDEFIFMISGDKDDDMMIVYPQKMWYKGEEPDVRDTEIYISSKKYKGIVYRVTYT